MDECQIIDYIRTSFGADIKSDPGLFDDVAFLESNRRLALKVDMFVAKTDMPPGMNLSQAARKSVISCVSDLSSKGATAEGLALSLGIPRRLANKNAVAALVRGFKRACSEFGIKLVAGDVNEATDLVIDCLVYGTPGQTASRSGARPGDAIYSTGPFGYSGLGLKHLLGGLKLPPSILKDCVMSVLEPDPPLKLSRRVVNSGSVHACMDSSDGLAETLREIGGQSGARMVIESLPAERSVLSCGLPARTIRDAILFGGEEYVTVFTADRNEEPAFAAFAGAEGGSIFRFGTVLAGRGVALKMEEGQEEVEGSGWVHLRRKG